MLRLLFVDDEPNVLEGTRRATANRQDRWDMHFAGSGPEALAYLADHEVDVVISDMRMPEMDGAELLRRVKATSPTTARIILSGYAEVAQVVRQTRVAHRFLGKPCDLEHLAATIESIRFAHRAVTDQSIRELVGRIEQLPSLGEVYADLMREIDDPNCSNKTLGAIVERDVALTAVLLRLVNSAYFGLPKIVESPGQAIGFLGLDVVRAVVAGQSLFADESTDLIDVAAVSRRAQQVGALARRITVLEGDGTSAGAVAYLTGMLHEVGALALAVVPDVDVIDVRAVLGSGDLTNEQLTFQADRFAVGAHLLDLWDFRPEVVEAVRALSRPVDPTVDSVTWRLRLARELVLSGQLGSEDSFDDEAAVLATLAQRSAELRERGSLPTPVEA